MLDCPQNRIILNFIHPRLATRELADELYVVRRHLHQLVHQLRLAMRGKVIACAPVYFIRDPPRKANMAAWG
jgi:hypothetical protein